MDAGAGSLADDEVDAEIFHRWIENFSTAPGGDDFVEEEKLRAVRRSENGGEVALRSRSGSAGLMER